MQKEEGITDVALSRGIGPDENGETTKPQGRVLEILESLQAQ
jgi:hypothetical protein